MKRDKKRERGGHGYTVIRTPEQVIPYLKKLKEAKVLAVDTETTGLDAHKDRLRLVQLGAEGNAGIIN